MDRWVAFYRDVMGFSLFQHFDDADISTDYSDKSGDESSSARRSDRKEDRS